METFIGVLIGLILYDIVKIVIKKGLKNNDSK
jgi:hypothetical protein